MGQKKNTRIQEAKNLFDRNLSLLRCPVCENTMAAVAGNSLLCSNKHCFDIAKQGYVNLLCGGDSEIYDKALFEARHEIFKRGFYLPVLQEITELIQKYAPDTQGLRILDAGCGEGYYLKELANKELTKLSKDSSENEDTEYIKQENKFSQMTCMGVDISKAGIIEAARTGEQALWCIADITSLPLQDNTVDVLLNILTPANYTEFGRVLSKDGIVIKIVPEKDYLKEIRESAKDWLKNKESASREAACAAGQHLNILEKIRITYKREINYEEYNHFIRMTPMTMGLTEKEKTEMLKNPKSTITVDLSIITGKPK